jgi:hypothetical protein
MSLSSDGTVMTCHGTVSNLFGVKQSKKSIYLAIQWPILI